MLLEIFSKIRRVGERQDIGYLGNRKGTRPQKVLGVDNRIFFNPLHCLFPGSGSYGLAQMLWRNSEDIGIEGDVPVLFAVLPDEVQKVVRDFLQPILRVL